MVKTVGRFSIDTDTLTVTGPEEYMQASGHERIRKIESGFNHQANFLAAGIDMYTRMRDRIFKRHVEQQVVDQVCQRRAARLF